MNKSEYMEFQERFGKDVEYHLSCTPEEASYVEYYILYTPEEISYIKGWEYGVMKGVYDYDQLYYFRKYFEKYNK